MLTKSLVALSLAGLSLVLASPGQASASVLESDVSYFSHSAVTQELAILKIHFDAEPAQKLAVYSSPEVASTKACSLDKKVFALQRTLAAKKPALLDCGVRVVSLFASFEGYVTTPILDENDFGYRVASASSQTPLWIKKDGQTVFLERETIRDWLEDAGALRPPPGAGGKVAILERAETGAKLVASCSKAEFNGWEDAVAADWMKAECLDHGCQSQASCSCGDQASGKAKCDAQRACPVGWVRWRSNSGDLLVHPGPGGGQGCD